mgnify:CR=1 FL=1
MMEDQIRDKMREGMEYEDVVIVFSPQGDKRRHLSVPRGYGNFRLTDALKGSQAAVGPNKKSSGR